MLAMGRSKLMRSWNLPPRDSTIVMTESQVHIRLFADATHAGAIVISSKSPLTLSGDLNLKGNECHGRNQTPAH